MIFLEVSRPFSVSFSPYKLKIKNQVPIFFTSQKNQNGKNINDKYWYNILVGMRAFTKI